MIDENFRWAVGLLVSICALLFGLWWKVEARQERKMDNMTEQTKRAHNNIYKKIDETEHELTRQHIQLREKIEEIWKYIVGKTNRD